MTLPKETKCESCLVLLRCAPRLCPEMGKPQRAGQQVVFTVRDALTGEMVLARLEEYKP